MFYLYTSPISMLRRAPDQSRDIVNNIKMYSGGKPSKSCPTKPRYNNLRISTLSRTKLAHSQRMQQEYMYGKWCKILWITTKYLVVQDLLANLNILQYIEVKSTHFSGVLNEEDIVLHDVNL